METVLFFYNIVIMIAFTLCCINFAGLYIKHRDKSQLMIAIVFFLFIFDNLLLYMREFLPDFTQGYLRHFLVYMYATNLSSFFIDFSYRLTFILLEKKVLSGREILLWGVIFVATLGVTALPLSPFGITAKIIVMGLPGDGVFAYALYRYWKKGGFPTRKYVPNIRPAFLWASLVFQIVSSAESILALKEIYLLAQGRELSIELFSIFYSAAAIRFLFRSQHAADKSAGASERATESELIAQFCDAYGLTQREKDILGFLAEGWSNADICKAAYISEGTVKAHTHNIYSKLDVKNRVQLGLKLRDFQKSGMKS